MKPLKPGDRVRVYETAGLRDACMFNGRVTSVEDDLVFVLGVNRPYHRKQCRLLVKKERRRVWINSNAFNYPELNDTAKEIHFASLKPMQNWIEFVEVKKK